ncbi:hypothetical protein PHEL85_1671 [Polaribacter sp. Hel1_85]|nr:hypothetical protein PHEL85_1671 [Polaribacter sp. Hel1_85]
MRNQEGFFIGSYFLLSLLAFFILKKNKKELKQTVQSGLN